VSRFRTILEWSVIAGVLVITGFLIYFVVLGAGGPAPSPSGLPDGTGGFYQTPLLVPEQSTKIMDNWKFTLTSSYTYTLAGRIVGRHEYPSTLPEGIIPLDLAVVNGELVRKDILSFFSFTMGYHTLTYSYDIPTALGLTEAYIDEHISNNHLVFLNSTLENEIKKIPEGSCVIVRGRLVDIRGVSPEKQYIVNTSTVRNDAYPAGCEIILVESCARVNCGN
jgi:hypothetical protein